MERKVLFGKPSPSAPKYVKKSAPKRARWNPDLVLQQTIISIADNKPFLHKFFQPVSIKHTESYNGGFPGGLLELESSTKLCFFH